MNKHTERKTEIEFMIEMVMLKPPEAIKFQFLNNTFHTETENNKTD